MIFSISEPSMIAEVRRRARDFARLQDFTDERLGRLALIVTELATNLLKHAGRGELLVDTFDDREGRGIEFLAIDKGPGIADINRALQDGYSTAGSPGTGLGAVHRLADVFALTSTPGHGTVMVARVAGATGDPRCRFISRGLAVAYPGEIACGDAWAVGYRGERAFVLMADGLGHGEAAAQAVERAVAVFQEKTYASVEELLHALHRGLGPTRGAALAVAEVDLARGRVIYSGIGNISGTLIFGPSVRRLVTLNGIAGHVASRIRAFTYEFSAPPTLILHTDGVGARWDMNSYPGLRAAHPSLIAGVLYRDCRRSRDDAGVIVLRGAQ